MKEIVGYTRFGSIIEVTWARDFGNWRVVEVSAFWGSKELFDCFAVLFALYKHLRGSAFSESRKRGRALWIYLEHFLRVHLGFDFRAQEIELGMKSPFEIAKYGRALLHPAFK